jgi:UDP-N-acetylglucosamine 2-epimerase (non-hydrolysing)
MKNKILFCFGTRPEIIKMAPLIIEAKSKGLLVEVCLTGQHKEMIEPFLSFFDIKENYNLDIMKKDQSLSEMTAAILNQMNSILDRSKPNYLFVQGDTTSTLTCGLASFYKKVPVVHIEAGLRTYEKYSPFPEEVNRQMISTFSSFNFCPTKQSAKNLKKENRNNIFVTGNTSIDALRMTKEKIRNENLDITLKEKYKNIDFNKKIILITCHRRENHGAPLKRILDAIQKVAKDSNIEIIYPVHLNPNIKEPVEESLSKYSNIHLLSPLEYLDFNWFMDISSIVLTDSGGVQEEGPYFNLSLA